MTTLLPPRLALSTAQRLSFDSLRGLIAFLLVIQHMGQCGFAVVPPGYTHQRLVSVAIFFTLSGFLITRCVLQPAVFQPWNFMKRRAARIFPPYLICLLFMVLLFAPSFLVNESLSDTLGNVASHLTLTYGWFDAYGDGVVPPFWTLSHEWTFYLFMAVTAVWMRRRALWYLTAGMIVGALILRSCVSAESVTLANNMRNWLCIMDLFAFGIMAGALSLKPGVMAAVQRTRVVVPLLLVGAGLAGWALYRHYSLALSMEGEFEDYWHFHEAFTAEFVQRRSSMLWYQPALACGTAIFLLVLWLRPVGVARWLRYTPLPWMGKISYSTYLWHWAIIFNLRRAKLRTPDDSFWQQDWPGFLLVLGTVYAFSYFAWYFFERPFMNPGGKPAAHAKEPAPADLGQAPVGA